MKLIKAYKCDICNEYCDNVWTIQGISEPKTHIKMSRLNNANPECCEECYDKIMCAIKLMIK